MHCACPEWRNTSGGNSGVNLDASTMKKQPARTIVHDKALNAWKHFQEICGVEPTGRDVDFIEQLKEKLDPCSADLEAALVDCTNDELVRAIFECAAPFVSMSRDILAFFKRAGASRGRTNWSLIVDEVPFELQAFADFVSEARRSWGYFQRPRLDDTNAFELPKMLRTSFSEPTEADVRRWSEAFLTAKRYDTWPPSLDPATLPPELQEAAELGRAVLDQARALGLPARFEKSAFDAPRPGFVFDPTMLATMENDHWLRNVIDGLARAKKLSPPKLAGLGIALADFFAHLPRELTPGEIEIEDLQRVLSLPVWKRRHEVYAIWIATQIVRALPEKQTEIQHDQGQIRFAFKKTKVASTSQGGGEIILYAERKQPLANPLGHGRKKNAQPDFGLWREDGAEPLCALIVEVKHYAQAASRSFSEALIDYARAHPDAEVVLVNYGPTADMIDVLDDSSEPVGKRCHHVADLTPLNPAAQRRLTAYVANAFDALRRNERTLLIDISGSMAIALRTEHFRQWLDGLGNDCVDRVILVDEECLWEGPLEETLARIASHTSWKGEDFVPIARRLLSEHGELRVVTDGVGYHDLKSAGDLEVEIDLGGSPANLILAKVRTRSNGV